MGNFKDFSSRSRWLQKGSENCTKTQTTDVENGLREDKLTI